MIRGGGPGGQRTVNIKTCICAVKNRYDVVPGTDGSIASFNVQGRRGGLLSMQPEIPALEWFVIDYPARAPGTEGSAGANTRWKSTTRFEPAFYRKWRFKTQSRIKRSEQKGR